MKTEVEIWVEQELIGTTEILGTLADISLGDLQGMLGVRYDLSCRLLRTAATVTLYSIADPVELQALGQICLRDIDY